MTQTDVADVVIIGSGIAALVAADRLSRDLNVIVITKSKKEDSNSSYAQGGVAAAFSRCDHWRNHFIDTMIAGNDHNSEEAVQTLVQKGPILLRKMIDQGMKFDKDDQGNVVLGQEGAHGKRRILHAGGDATGRALVQFMLNRLKSTVQIVEDEMAVDLLVKDQQCFGVKVRTNSGKLKNLYAKNTILAAGGCGGLFLFTSNDVTITGDGMAMAYRAGADLVDLEFVQFHPTMLYVNGDVKGLISEAVRGEGAILVTNSGKRLMDGVHPQKDLAPRDVVSREINQAVLRGEQVFLDISMIDDFPSRFPTITQMCEQYGIRIDDGRIPVVPGAHFHMGGVEVNQQGQTSVENLYAIGEVACTGVHGANRLASNSLLEGIVFANELANHLLCNRHHVKMFEIPIDSSMTIRESKRSVLPTKDQIRALMMKYTGIVRTEEGLNFAKRWLEQFLPNEYVTISEDLSEDEIIIVNMLQASWLITTSALMREESRGGHFRADYPFEKNEWGKRKLIRNLASHVYATH
ncbi:L-aspartate oxidase [Calidifontibacillus oryziterrae]|uniref:L-aspartate oxidase n=1 Tax=Calidifontibacillus oryziterrae TaxID=1191699 RepID=UPI0002DA5334|nr:L-aspartate oxidase [Calidifontibacillus oryziterrae]